MVPGAGGRGGGDVVHGELHRLNDPERVFVWLDAFEGVARGTSSVTGPDEYERVERTVHTETGSAVAWVYLFSGDVPGLQRVATGRWDSAV